MTAPPASPAPSTVRKPARSRAGLARARRLQRQLAALRRVGDVLASAMDADAVTRLALEAAVESLHGEAGSVLLHDRERRVLRFRHVIGSTPEVEASLLGLEVPEMVGISGKVLRLRRGFIVANVARDRDHNRAVDARTTFTTRGVIAAPISTPGGGILGVIEVINSKGRGFDRDDLAVLTMLAAQAGAAMETARLHQTAALASLVHRVGDVSHDVKNLLTPVDAGLRILGMLVARAVEAGALADTAVAAGALRDALEELRTMGPELTSLALSGVSDVQERVREIADAVKGIVSSPVFEATDLHALVHAVARVLYPVAEPAGVAIDLSGVATLPPVLLDRRRMYNCLYNLIHNAIPETPPGGTIRVLTDRVADQLRIIVADTGRGMTPLVRSRLFTDDAVSTKPGGTGLGTRIVRGAVEAHGGTVSVVSAPGEGACFTLSIPWKAPP